MYGLELLFLTMHALRGRVTVRLPEEAHLGIVDSSAIQVAIRHRSEKSVCRVYLQTLPVLLPARVGVIHNSRAK